jgi:uncharacterized repeat protein (TIGR01451 family)
VATGIDLTVDKTDNANAGNQIPRNGTLRYTITVSNLGTQDAFDMVVRDTLPAGVTFRSVAMSGDPHDFTCAQTAPASGTVECSGGDLRGEYSGTLTRPTDTATIVIEVFAPDTPGVIENEVRVDPDLAIAEVDEANNIDREATAVVNGLIDGNTWIDLDIAKADGSDGITTNFSPTIATSGTLDYTGSVRNQGTADAFNVVVRAQLPAGATFRSAFDLTGGVGAFTCAQSGDFVTCSGGTVKAGGTRDLRISTFAPPTQGPAVLEVIVDPANAIPEADESDNQANETTTVVAGGPGAYIDLDVLAPITESSDPVAPSGFLTYSVTIRNTGSGDAFGVSFRATLPTGSTFRSADDRTPPAPPNPDAFSCTQAGGVVTCTGARINAGTSRVVDLSVFAPTIPGTYRLDVTLDPNNAIPEGNEGNNSAEEYTRVQLGGGGGFINLTASLSDTPDPVTPGGQISYTLSVSNTGTDDAFNVKVRNVLPAGTGFVSATGTDGFVCLQAGGVVDCSGGYVKGTNNGGGAAVISITVTAPQAHDVTVTDQAIVDPFNEIAEASEIDNAASTTTKVESKVDLEPTAITGYPGVNSEGTVTFTVKNNGAAATSGVLVVANLPIGVIPLDMDSPAGWSCATFENPINQAVCTGSLGAGATQSFTVRVFRTSDNDLNSSVTVDPNNTIVEYDETNNVAV